jgi:hypothetical protein
MRAIPPALLDAVAREPEPAAFRYVYFLWFVRELHDGGPLREQLLGHVETAAAALGPDRCRHLRALVRAAA